MLKQEFQNRRAFSGMHPVNANRVNIVYEQGLSSRYWVGSNQRVKLLLDCLFVAMNFH
jgi:hypothetical protein